MRCRCSSCGAVLCAPPERRALFHVNTSCVFFFFAPASAGFGGVVIALLAAKRLLKKGNRRDRQEQDPCACRDSEIFRRLLRANVKKQAGSVWFLRSSAFGDRLLRVFRAFRVVSRLGEFPIRRFISGSSCSIYGVTLPHTVSAPFERVFVTD